MKRILITAAAIIAAALSANAQQVDTIKISNITTTHIRFSSEIKYVDLSPTKSSQPRLLKAAGTL